MPKLEARIEPAVPNDLDNGVVEENNEIEEPKKERSIIDDIKTPLNDVKQNLPRNNLRSR